MQYHHHLPLALPPRPLVGGGGRGPGSPPRFSGTCRARARGGRAKSPEQGVFLSKRAERDGHARSNQISGPAKGGGGEPADSVADGRGFVACLALTPLGTTATGRSPSAPSLHASPSPIVLLTRPGKGILGGSERWVVAGNRHGKLLFFAFPCLSRSIVPAIRPGPSLPFLSPSFVQLALPIPAPPPS